MKKNYITNFNEMWVNGVVDQCGKSTWLIKIVKSGLIVNNVPRSNGFKIL
jgi:hypothetical protein